VYSTKKDYGKTTKYITSTAYVTKPYTETVYVTKTETYTKPYTSTGYVTKVTPRKFNYDILLTFWQTETGYKTESRTKVYPVTSYVTKTQTWVKTTTSLYTKPTT
jgi:hypothetical protein